MTNLPRFRLPGNLMRILLVAGGDIEIPPPSWGGVENVVWQQYNFLTSAGHHVDILNKKRKKTITGFLARPWTYDLVHLHIDSGAKAWNKLQRLFGFKLALTSHYGYAAFPALWEASYQATFWHMLRVPYHITLSPQILEVAREAGYSGTSFVLPNGIVCADMRFDPAPAPRQALVLGRVQERKKQQFLADLLAGHAVSCDMIGPDDSGFVGNGVNVHYKGSWERAKVLQSLTEYACMILISDGEAHAGVILEAMAAGLSLVVSQEAAHNLDTSHPWVYVVDRSQPQEIADAIKSAVADNARYRSVIRRYCEDTFDWKVIGPQYVRIIEAIVAGKQNKLVPPKTPCPLPPRSAGKSE